MKCWKSLQKSLLIKISLLSTFLGMFSGAQKIIVSTDSRNSVTLHSLFTVSVRIPAAACAWQLVTLPQLVGSTSKLCMVPAGGDQVPDTHSPASHLSSSHIKTQILFLKSCFILKQFLYFWHSSKKNYSIWRRKRHCILKII